MCAGDSAPLSAGLAHGLQAAQGWVQPIGGPSPQSCACSGPPPSLLSSSLWPLGCWPPGLSSSMWSLNILSLVPPAFPPSVPEAVNCLFSFSYDPEG